MLRLAIRNGSVSTGGARWSLFVTIIGRTTKCLSSTLCIVTGGFFEILIKVGEFQSVDHIPVFGRGELNHK